MADADAIPTEDTTEPVAGAFDELVIITGFSGAGKSTAMNVFEDAGYFCVDNLPPEMIRGLIDLFVHEGAKVERAAVGSDVRGGEHFEPLRDVLGELLSRRFNIGDVKKVFPEHDFTAIGAVR